MEEYVFKDGAVECCIIVSSHLVFLCLILEMEILCICQSEASKWVKVAQSCLTLCYPMDYTVHGILQARILEWVAVPFSRGSSQPRDQTQVSHIADRFFNIWAIREAVCYLLLLGSILLLVTVSFNTKKMLQILFHALDYSCQSLLFLSDEKL